MNPIVKICGLTTPATLDAALAAGADLVGFVRFAKSPRHVGLEHGRALSLRARGKGAARRARRRCRRRGARRRSSRPSIRTCCSCTARETPGARRRHPRPLRTAGHEGDRHRRRAPTSPRSAAYAGVADRLLLDAKPPPTRRRCPAATGSPSTGGSSPGLTRRSPSCCQGASTPRQRRRRDRAHAASRARRCLVRRRATARRQGSRRGSRPSSRPPAPALGRASIKPKDKVGVTAQPQPNSFRTGPDERGHFGIFGGRFVAETLMPLDPRAGEGLRRRPRPTRPSRPRWPAT